MVVDAAQLRFDADARFGLRNVLDFEMMCSRKEWIVSKLIGDLPAAPPCSTFLPLQHTLPPILAHQTCHPISFNTNESLGQRWVTVGEHG